jgi:uncharacterized secreted protein with C-terminal beta-propeller domain
MIGNFVYLVTQEGVDSYSLRPPIIYGKMNVMPEIYYFDNPDENYQFNTIASIDLSNDNLVDSKTFMLGYSNTLMVSENNIYIAYHKSQRWCYGWFRCQGQQNDEKTKFYSVVVPLLEGTLKQNVDRIIASSLNETEEWDAISKEFSAFYESIKNEKDEKVQEAAANMLGKIANASDEYDIKQRLGQDSTVIQKIAISNGVLTYKSKGEVTGSLLDQFSLDEFDGNLRLATTIEVWANQRVQYNNVYVLDSEMKTIGTLEKIAKDERIYSTRFIGDKLYMVTFRNVDPFFVISLSNPAEPKVLGYLKIPGFSNYLHPYDETHVIGIGKETMDNEFGGVTTKGVKIALFDVTDVANPKLVD